jgi:ferrous iron transport protein B
LETKRDRFITIFMSPNMSCGARLPVYALFAAAFFPGRAGVIVFSLYVVGILVAILTGFIMKVTLFRGTPSHFVMELPPYHAPRIRFVMGEAWRRLLVFVRRAGVTITIIVTVLAALNTFGADEGESGQRSTLLSVIGRGVTPVFAPMGIETDNWPATVGLFTGIFAKEAVIGALNSLYGQNEVALDDEVQFGSALLEAVATIPQNLSAAVGGLADPLGAGVVGADESAVAEEVGADALLMTRLRRRFSGPAAYAYLLFVLIYFPCVASLAAAIREMGITLGWLLAAYSTLVAWVVATLYYQLATTPQLLPILAAVAVVAIVVVVLFVLGRTVYRPERLEVRE